MTVGTTATTGAATAATGTATTACRRDMITAMIADTTGKAGPRTMAAMTGRGPRHVAGTTTPMSRATGAVCPYFTLYLLKQVLDAGTMPHKTDK